MCIRDRHYPHIGLLCPAAGNRRLGGPFIPAGVVRPILLCASSGLFVAFLYRIALYPLQPFAAERMGDADERGVQTAGCQ